VLRFFINSPENRANLHWGSGATVAANGTFSFDSTTAHGGAGDWIDGIYIFKINNVITVQAYDQVYGYSAAFPFYNTTVGSNYNLPY